MAKKPHLVPYREDEGSWLFQEFQKAEEIALEHLRQLEKRDYEEAQERHSHDHESRAKAVEVLSHTLKNLTSQLRASRLKLEAAMKE